MKRLSQVALGLWNVYLPGPRTWLMDFFPYVGRALWKIQPMQLYHQLLHIGLDLKKQRMLKKINVV